ncbi:aminoacetone oxidase family FAD-binding enzyme [Candidatus Peregrinibacteria bacterium]|nr:MAG: aminoacetone oxidase family FAD-binding enzyme [Candidatus Peregrinibacteria bacterium]
MDILVIGGGAAGMMAAVEAVQNPQAKVMLIEKNPGLGHKVLISGGGRCNVTTGFHDLRALVQRYPRGGKFLQSAFYRFSPQAVMDWFETHDVPLKVEADGRVFPQSDNGKDVLGALEKSLQAKGAKILLRKEVASIQKERRFLVTLKSGESFEVDKVILTTGGQAYRHTGSTGDGYSFAESLGHHITPLAPSLNSFIVKENGLVNWREFPSKKFSSKSKRSKNMNGRDPSSSLIEASRGQLFLRFLP